MTYNQIINIFSGIASTNPFIKRFGSGEMNEIEVDGPTSILYPILWVVPQSVVINDNSQDWIFRILVFEIDDIDDSKQQTILSSTLQIITDVIKTFKMELDDDVEINLGITTTPFTHRFVDYCTGWWADIKITTAVDNSPCDIPGY